MAEQQHQPDSNEALTRFKILFSNLSEDQQVGFLCELEMQQGVSTQRMLELIECLDEDEQLYFFAELQKRQSDTAERVLALFTALDQDVQLHHLDELERRQRQWQREYYRASASIAIDYDTEDDSYQDMLENISLGGVFIRTQEPFAIGQEISLNLSASRFIRPCRVRGKVVRRDFKGIGIAFDHLNRQQKNVITLMMKKRQERWSTQGG